MLAVAFTVWAELSLTSVLGDWAVRWITSGLIAELGAAESLEERC